MQRVMNILSDKLNEHLETKKIEVIEDEYVDNIIVSIKDDNKVGSRLSYDFGDVLDIGLDNFINNNLEEIKGNLEKDLLDVDLYKNIDIELLKKIESLCEEEAFKLLLNRFKEENQGGSSFCWGDDSHLISSEIAKKFTSAEKEIIYNHGFHLYYEEFSNDDKQEIMEWNLREVLVNYNTLNTPFTHSLFKEQDNIYFEDLNQIKKNIEKFDIKDIEDFKIPKMDLGDLIKVIKSKEKWEDLLEEVDIQYKRLDVEKTLEECNNVGWNIMEDSPIQIEVYFQNKLIGNDIDSHHAFSQDIRQAINDENDNISECVEAGNVLLVIDNIEDLKEINYQYKKQFFDNFINEAIVKEQELSSNSEDEDENYDDFDMGM